MKAPIVSILTHCPHPVLAYGSMLVFKSIRVGFPTAQIEVRDNGSHPEMVERIRQAADGVGASFEAMPLQHYSDVWRDALFNRQWADSSVVFVDPDVIFWESVENWQFGNALMAGRLIPERGNHVSISRTRLHPSHLWVDIDRLRHEIVTRFPSEAAGRWNYIGPACEMVAGRLHSFDTLGPLYFALESHCTVFEEHHLNAYDHLFLGSHLPAIRCLVKQSVGDAIWNAHRAAAKGELTKLRGIWRQQQAYFLGGSTKRTLGLADFETSGLSIAKQLQHWQGLNYSDEELASTMSALTWRLHMEPPEVGGGPRPLPPRQRSMPMARRLR